MIAVNIHYDFIREQIGNFNDYLRDKGIKDVTIEPPYIKCRYVLELLGMGTKIVPVTITFESYENDLWVHFRAHLGLLTGPASKKAAGQVAELLNVTNHGGTVMIPISEKFEHFEISMNEDYLHVRLGR